jgi:hypothetical protein
MPSSEPALADSVDLGISENDRFSERKADVEPSSGPVMDWYRSATKSLFFTRTKDFLQPIA